MNYLMLVVGQMIGLLRLFTSPFFNPSISPKLK